MEHWQLKQRQSLPLEVKIEMSKKRIIEFYEKNDGNTYISFSGGKDSTVLLHLVRSIYKEIKAVFCDTGLEYPEIREHVKSINNVDWIKPIMNFKDVIDKYGYPVVSKETSERIYSYKNYNLSDEFRNKLINEKIPKKWQYLLNTDIKISSKCCNEMKKKPFKKYEKNTDKKPFVGLIAEESYLRTQQYLKHGCNSFNSNKKRSTPLAFWTEQDILQYIQQYNLNIPSVYGQIYTENKKLKLTGVKRTGCVFCAYGVHMEQYPNRFQRLEKTHNKLHNYCINKLGFKNVLNLIKVPYQLPKVTKEKYKISTKKISCRVDENKFNTVKKIHGNIKNTEIIDNLIDCIYKSIDKRKKYNNQISLFSEKERTIDKSKYKIITKKIDIRVDESKFNTVKTYLQIKNNTKLIDFLIDEKIKSVGQIIIN